MRLESIRTVPATPLGAVFGAVLALAGGLAAMWLALDLPRPVCAFRAWTGLPCPTCRSTRLAEALLGGDPLAALAHNPLVFLTLTGVAVWGVVSIARLALGLPTRRVLLEPREKQVLRLLAVAAIAAGWLYVIWRG